MAYFQPTNLLSNNNTLWTCFLDRRSFFDPQKLFWSISQKLYARQMLIQFSEKVCYIILLPFSNSHFSFGAVRELKFTIQFMAPRLPHEYTKSYLVVK